MEGVGAAGVLSGPFPWVDDRQAGDDDQHLAQAALTLGLQQHPGQPRVQRQRGQPVTDRGEPGALPSAGSASAPSSVSSRIPSATWLRSGASTNGKSATSPSPASVICRITEARLVRRISGSVNCGPAPQILLAIEADAHAGRDPTAASGALVRRGLGDRLDRQSLHLGPGRVPRDPGGAGVDHVPDAGHGERGLRDVGGQYDPPAGVGCEDPLLLRGGQPGVQRQDLGGPRLVAPECLGGIADLPLAGQEDQDVARAQGAQLGDRVHDAADLVGLAVGQQRAIAHLDRIGPARNLDDRRTGALGPGEVRREPRRVDGRRGDDDLQIMAAQGQLPQVPEQEVDVEAAFVGLVENDRVVATEVAVAADLGQQHAVGHHLEPGRAGRVPGEPDLVAHQVPDLGAQLVRDPLGHSTGRDPPRLGVTDRTAAQLKTDLRQLGGLPDPVSPATISTWCASIAWAISSCHAVMGSAGS